MAFFFFNDTATTEIYTLSLHDALPISGVAQQERLVGVVLLNAGAPRRVHRLRAAERPAELIARSEEHTSELQSQSNLVCRLLLDKTMCEGVRRRLQDSARRRDRCLPVL